MRMRNLLFAFIACSTFGQETASPTIAQCKSDSATWYDSVSKAGSEKDEIEVINRLSIDELDHRAEEMTLCIEVDTKKNRDYMQMFGMYAGEVHNRERNFLKRHDLLNAFRSEDTAGKR